MPYKNKADKNAYNKAVRLKNRIVKTCKLCNATLPAARSTFCNDGCSRRFYLDKQNAARKALNDKLKQELPQRYCKYCKSPLDKKLNIQKLFCKDTECSYKFNQIESKKLRDKKKAKRKAKPLRDCRLEECDKKFSIETCPTKRYCSDECKKRASVLKNRKVYREKHTVPEEAYIAEKKETVRKEPDYNISPEFLQPRGSRQRKKLGLKPTEFI